MADRGRGGVALPSRVWLPGQIDKYSIWPFTMEEFYGFKTLKIVPSLQKFQQKCYEHGQSTSGQLPLNFYLSYLSKRTIEEKKCVKELGPNNPDLINAQ